MQKNQKRTEIIPWSCDKLSFIQRSIEKFLEKWSKKRNFKRDCATSAKFAGRID